MILEIFTICSLSVIVGLSWLSARVQEASAAGAVSGIPHWMINVQRFLSEETEEFSRLKKINRKWRWFLLGFYLFVMAMIVLNPDPQKALETIALAILNVFLLAGWIYYLERVLKK
jgi:hypothetical protein